MKQTLKTLLVIFGVYSVIMLLCITVICIDMYWSIQYGQPSDFSVNYQVSAVVQFFISFGIAMWCYQQYDKMKLS